VDAAVRDRARAERDRLLRVAEGRFHGPRRAGVLARIQSALPIRNPSFLPPNGAFWAAIQRNHIAYKERQAPLMEAAHRAAADMELQAAGKSRSPAYGRT
jgi:hypothetical protein